MNSEEAIEEVAMQKEVGKYRLEGLPKNCSTGLPKKAEETVTWWRNYEF